MKIQKQSSRLVTPSYETKSYSYLSTSTTTVPLSPFDRAAGNAHMAIIYAYKAPTPPNSALEIGLRLVLADYREWAGRLTDDRRAIVLNDKGVRFVEATASCTLEEATPFKSTRQLWALHPSMKGIEELMQVQLTRFTCGSLVIGYTTNHLVADGEATGRFLAAWGQATRGLSDYPVAIHDRVMLKPRDPLSIEFDHSGNEYMGKTLVKDVPWEKMVSDVRLHKAHFSPDFLAKLKARVSVRCLPGRGYSTFECLVAHLWRKVTRARGVPATETSQLRIPVNVRGRLVPPIPHEYFGNMVLWAFPRVTVRDLLGEPLNHVAEWVRAAIAQVNDRYVRSFVDFDTCVEIEGLWNELVPTAEVDSTVFCPNMEVNSWLRLPFQDVDFGSGGPDLFMPSCFPLEGVMVIVPSAHEKGGIEVYLSLFEANKAAFQRICQSID
ncbi:hypothetical protein AMTRI_Chr03g53740 [Amborella trichopoda]|uniref:Uncharacterized protein n=1 Tax=Amborella trichopoda TaxID=13333 RepID=W1P074_AMBTC|nr:agmatine coumaroyltransferase-1 [Amborella trichopoda]ERN01333.1 hypothetical protein AMTR_s00002p00256740 [Amborella trichopoda]|eukprot:XP_006838764.3 agmatine coumaroyltransferase-1 [Amborella trichopoda]